MCDLATQLFLVFNLHRQFLSLLKAPSVFESFNDETGFHSSLLVVNTWICIIGVFINNTSLTSFNKNIKLPAGTSIDSDECDSIKRY